jgi:tetratricopeptide (TPR) repeat protein
MGKESEAIATLDRIPPDHERYADGRVQVAGIYEGNGDFAGAQLEIERAREVEPSRPLDLYAASLRAKGGDVVGAIAFLEEMLEESPEDAEVLYNIGVIHGEAKNVEEAIRYMRIVLGLNPDHASALNYVGYTFAERGENLDEAEAMIARALELRPEDGYITDSLGWVYYMRAQPLLAEGNVVAARPWLDRAIDELERAAELTGGDPVISEHLGDVYLALGDKERALDYYEEAVGLDPRPDEQPDLHQKLRRLRGELGQRCSERFRCWRCRWRSSAVAAHRFTGPRSPRTTRGLRPSRPDFTSSRRSASLSARAVGCARKARARAASASSFCWSSGRRVFASRCWARSHSA